MKKCNEIKNSLPLYLDDSLPPADKKAVEEHLKTCAECTKILTQLSKTLTLVNNLAEVNPPPWFKQKIMAGVREKSEKKSIVRKLFYPLQIKVPIQVFATVFIAVIAVYIYRAGENQMMKVAISPAPVMEFQKEQLPKQLNKLAADEALQTQKQPAPAEKKATPQKEEAPQKAVGAVQPKGQPMQKEERSMPQREERPQRFAEADVDRVKDASEQMSSGIKADKHKGGSAARSVAIPQAAMEKKQESSALGASMKAAPAPLTQSQAAKPKIILRTADIGRAAVEAEKLLTKYEAKNIVRRTAQGNVILTAQIKNQKIKDFMLQLKSIGPIEPADIPADNSANETSVVIDIVGN
jgi:hypothetical protein